MFPALLEMYAMKSKMNSILLSRPMTFEKKLFPVGVIQVTDVLGNNTKIIKKAHCVDSLKMRHEPCYAL